MKNERNKQTQTELLYETDGMLTEFDASVIGSEKCTEREGYSIILDRTAFFPEGGGQKADTGYIVCAPDRKIRVSDVQTVDGKVCHYTDEEIGAGTVVTGILDKQQRFARMQEHGAEHLLCGIIHNRFGYDNVGFHSSDDGLVIDINGELTDKQLMEVEEAANCAVFENVPFTISFPSPEEAEGLEYRSKIDIDENIRLVTIEGYDCCACCAPHVNSTGQLGVIKIISVMPHRGGMRITMKAGMNAYRDYALLDDQNARIMEILSSKRYHTAEQAEAFSDRQMRLREENTALKKKLSALAAGSVVEDLKGKTKDDHPFELLFFDDLDPTGLRNLVNECTAVYNGIVCAFLRVENGYRYIFAVNEEDVKSTDLKAFADDFNKNCQGRGGGSDIMVQGTSQASAETIEAYFAKKA